MRIFKPLRLFAILFAVAAVGTSVISLAEFFRLQNEWPSEPIVWVGTLLVSTLAFTIGASLLFAVGSALVFLFDLFFPKKEDK